MTWAVGSDKESGPRPGWRLGTGEGKLPRVALASVLGRMSLACFLHVPKSGPVGAAGWSFRMERTLPTYIPAPRQVEITHSTAGEEDGRATFLLELSLDASRSPFTWRQGGGAPVLPASLPRPCG